jgi:hypothetical protein
MSMSRVTVKDLEVRLDGLASVNESILAMLERIEVKNTQPDHVISTKPEPKPRPYQSQGWHRQEASAKVQLSNAKQQPPADRAAYFEMFPAKKPENTTLDFGYKRITLTPTNNPGA